MKYLGPARKENAHVIMPDAFAEVPDGQAYEALEIGGDILLVLPPLDRERLAQVEPAYGGANRSIEEHRKSLEGLAQ